MNLKTQKILIPRDVNNPHKYVKDYLFPDLADGKPVLRAIKSKKVWQHGMIILTSEIDEHDIFKRIVDSGHKIESVNALMELLKQYVTKLPTLKIGNVVNLNPDSKDIDLVVAFNGLTGLMGRNGEESY